MDWFAELVIGAHSRDPLARKDGGGTAVALWKLQRQSIFAVPTVTTACIFSHTARSQPC